LGADRLTDAMPVLRPPLKSPKNEHVERALEQVGFLALCRHT
jgi:hypothetical protein